MLRRYSSLKTVDLHFFWDFTKKKKKALPPKKYKPINSHVRSSFQIQSERTPPPVCCLKIEKKNRNWKKEIEEFLSEAKKNPAKKTKQIYLSNMAGRTVMLLLLLFTKTIRWLKFIDWHTSIREFSFISGVECFLRDIHRI